MLPAEWRPVVWDLWAYWSHLVPSQLALATRLRHWRADGLELADVLYMAARLTDPDVSAAVKFPGDLLAELSRLAAVRIADHRRDARVRADRDRAARERAESAGSAAVRLAVAGVGEGGP